MERLTLNIQLSPLALNLRSLRNAKGLTIHQVSKACKIPAIDLWNYETDKKIPSEKIKNRLLEYLSK